eukprot:TRINITY_DN1724_c2_g1_i1.p1 TRINITY_DN1724_c2_g1~~TRINITY_DN1724_c2_g1_i1.p1  ORF type:complete len:352 (+),score=119.14 TRINITY_DN1724_c2_g1_i1:38-1093(+)
MPPTVRARPGFRQVKGGGMAMNTTESIRQAKQAMMMQAALGDTDIADTSRNHLGVYFRYLFMLVILLFIVLLMVIKLDGEHITPPERDSDETEEFAKADDDVTAQYFSKVNRERQAKEAGETKIQETIRRKKEQQEIQEAHEEFRKKMASPECDAACRKEGQQIQVLHDQVSSVVLTDYYEVLEMKAGFGVGKKELKEKFEEMKQKIENKDPEVEHLDLAELTEAYGTLHNNEARMYYNLYGRKPPAHMRHNAAFARHGGWGQEFQTQVWKVKKLLGWLRYFDSKYMDLGMLGLIMLFTALPVILNFRQLVRTMKGAFPDLDPDNAEQHEERMEALRRSTYQRPRKHGGGR